MCLSLIKHNSIFHLKNGEDLNRIVYSKKFIWSIDAIVCFASIIYNNLQIILNYIALISNPNSSNVLISFFFFHIILKTLVTSIWFNATTLYKIQLIQIHEFSHVLHSTFNDSNMRMWRGEGEAHNLGKWITIKYNCFLQSIPHFI